MQQSHLDCYMIQKYIIKAVKFPANEQMHLQLFALKSVPRQKVCLK